MTGTEVTLEEIISETGGIKEVSSDTHFYIENLVGEAEEADVAQVTSGANIFKYVQSQMPLHIPKTLTQLFQISGTTDTFNVDLTPYIDNTKLHLKFPTERNFANININITGLKDRIIPLESITMSGLDEDTDFLPMAKRGTITFTLDSQDYEFPESIYHFGGFATGKVYRDSNNDIRPNYIFLHIDYAETMDSAHIYIVDNGIYAESSKEACEVWNQDTLGDSPIVLLNVESTTLILKNNGIVKSFIQNQLHQSFLLDFFSHIMHQYMPIIVPTSNVVLATSNSSPTSMFNAINPITAKLKNDSMFSLSARGMPVSPPSDDHTEIHGVVYFCKNMANNVLEGDYLSILRSDLTDSNNWNYLPTEYGLYRVIVKGKYLEMQLNK